VNVGANTEGGAGMGYPSSSYLHVQTEKEPDEVNEESTSTEHLPSSKKRSFTVGCSFEKLIPDESLRGTLFVGAHGHIMRHRACIERARTIYNAWMDERYTKQHIKNESASEIKLPLKPTTKSIVSVAK
tara:strand:- start:936 stop:1322 length:387 start_codon:yes stop_codon:yes gene_type:complete